ncbi:hypothetical protein BZA70DRAFT_78709 [Myxozyma melibiosi]|uniref:C2H2-type domain-containing protein n=1 Tax=Myxozyma melibiosi TaxID=54550 RepID=A0ABR1F2P7_9ASCO
MSSSVKAFCASTASASASASSFASMQTVLQLGSALDSNSRRPRKQYICRHCQVAFKRCEHLARHERSHTAERPFVCPVCSRGFTRKDLLVRHQRMCDGTRPKRKERRRSVIQRVIIRPNEVDPPELDQQQLQLQQQHQQQPSPDSKDLLREQLLDASTPHQPSQEIQLHSDPLSSKPKPAWNDHALFDMLDLEHSPAESSVALSTPSSVAETTTTPTRDLQEAVVATASQFALNMQDWSFLDQFRIPDIFNNNLFDLPAAQPSVPTTPSWLHTEFGYSPTSTDNETIVVDDKASQLTDASPSPMPSSAPHHNYQSLPSAGAVPGSNFTASASAGGPPATFPTRSTQTQHIWIVPFDDNCRASMIALLSNLTTSRDIFVFDTLTMQRYLSVYVTNFSLHFPIIHPSVYQFEVLKEYHRNRHLYSNVQSDSNYPWEAVSTAVLTVVMAANGAVHCLAHKDARVLRNWARRLLAELPSEATLPDERRLGLVQAHLILSGFDAWSGDDQGMQVALDEQAFFVRFCTLGLKKRCERVTSSWKEWIVRESCHRLFWGIFIVLSDYNITFHQMLPLRINDVGILLPDSETLWHARCESDWLALLPSCPPPSSIDAVVLSILNDPSCRVNEIVEMQASPPSSWFKARRDGSEFAGTGTTASSGTGSGEDGGLAGGDDGAGSPSSVTSTGTTEEDETATRVIVINEKPHVLSLFSVYIVMHVIMNHIWTADQVLQVGYTPSAPRIQELNQLRLFTFQQAERILTQSAQNLAKSQAEFARRVPGAAGVPVSPMIFNSCSLVRVMQVRLFKSSSVLNSLLCDPELKANMDDALEEFLDSKPEMGSLVDKALDEAVLGLEVQVRAGPTMIKRLAPVYWNVEHALCGWDSSK